MARELRRSIITIIAAMDRIPVRLRLSLAHSIWMVLVFLTVGVGIVKLVENHLLASVDAALLSSAASIRDARQGMLARSPESEFFDQFFEERLIRPYAQLIDLSGKVRAKTQNVLISLPVTGRALSRAEDGLETFESFVDGRRDESMRQVTLPLIRFGRFTGELIQVATPLVTVRQTTNAISLVLWIALPSGLALSIFFGYLLAARSFKPVRTMTKAVATLGSHDLSTRLPLPRAKDEIRDLAQTFNAMLGRLDDAFKRLRRFSGDVAHELRTPLAVLRGEAELALRRERSREDYEEALRAIVHETIVMTGVVEDLLLFARAESRALAMTLAPIPIEFLVEELRSSVMPVFVAKNLELDITADATGEISANLTYLCLAIKNLLLNAAKYSVTGSRVFLTIQRTVDSVSFSVRDYGEGIPPEALPYIFDPFFRADTARNRAAGGAGIGLSLAIALVKLHGGLLSAHSELGKGAEFVVRIPTKPSKLS